MKILTTAKDRRKLFRSILQSTIIIYVFILLIKILFYPVEYKPYDINHSETVADKGFIAISYVAVDREGNSSMISTARLDEHLEALSKNGYVTITQGDIIDYYEKGTCLPKKAMFLMFEDGRRDTAIFSNELVQKYNFKGTMLTYAERFNSKDLKFLQTDDLIDLVDSSFWEIGTNGYRLSYTNVFDRYDRYIGELSPTEFSTLRAYLGRKYNHYLMDFLRDENNIPKETYDDMVSRISTDYMLIKDIYEEELGNTPKAYVLIHSNTGRFGTNEKASAVNEKWIKELFKMNFNREGNSLNNLENDIYDLTRMQPQAYWYPNHLLMRIYHDTKEDIIFEDGDIERKKEWETIDGASEFRKSVIALTSEPEGRGLIKLKNSEGFKNLKLSVRLTGNKLGTQKVYLRADEELEDYLSVQLKNNFLYIEENGEIIYELDLNQHDNIIPQTIEEDMKETLSAELNTYKEGINIWGEVITKMIEPKAELGETSKEYFQPTIQISEAGNRQLNILLLEDRITVKIDDKLTADQLKLRSISKGSVYLESAWGEYGFSQRNIDDDIYDGVFEDFTLKSVEDDRILYSNQLVGFEMFKSMIEEYWDMVINWFIRNL